MFAGRLPVSSDGGHSLIKDYAEFVDIFALIYLNLTSISYEWFGNIGTNDERKSWITEW